MHVIQGQCKQHLNHQQARSVGCTLPSPIQQQVTTN